MIMDEILKELHTLKLPGMARFWQSLTETHRMDSLTLIDGLTLMLQSEREERSTKKNERLIKEAHFRYKASFEELMIDAARGVDAGKVARLGTGDYIKKGDSIIVTGASGCGKSFLATALGYKACFQGYRVQYYNMQKLLAQLKLSRIEGVSIKLFEKIAKADLLIIDDFGMNVLEGNQQNDFMEILEDRHALKSTIIVSQLPVSKWFDVIGNGLIADAALDRIVHTSHRFELKGYGNNLIM